MPQVTTCPECRKQLKVPDNLIGQKVRCPGCSTMFLSVANTPEEDPPARSSSRHDSFREHPEPPRNESRRDGDEDADDRKRRRSRDEDDEDDRPRRRRDRDDDDDDDRPRRRRDRDDDDEDDRPRGGKAIEGWRKVRSGLNYLLLGGWILVGTLGIGVLGGALMFALGVGTVLSLGSGGGGANALGSLFYLGLIIDGLMLLGMLAAFVLQGLGMGFCIAVPAKRDSSGKTLAISAFACFCVHALFTGGTMTFGRVNALLSSQGAGTGSPPGALIVGGCGMGSLGGIAAVILWSIFLRVIANNLGDAYAGGKAITNMILWLVYWVAVWPLTFCIASLAIGLSLSGARSGQNPVAAAGVAAFLIFGTVFLLGVGLYVWYLFIVREIRVLVDERIRWG